MSSKSDFRKKILQMVEVGYTETGISRFYDYVNMLAIVLNLFICILYTFDYVDLHLHNQMATLEFITVVFFLMDYILRIYTADLLFPDISKLRAILKYIFSFTGIVDLLSCVPYFLPVFFPGGTVAFRMFRVVRIFRLFRVNAYYDSLNVITDVIKSKKQQLVSSVFIIIILMIASSLCMYSLEHESQPEVFQNAFSGIWWSASTLLTVGYGDIYPITTAGKALSIIITFLGVGMVAIPTGIISAGFVEQYSKIRDNEKDNTSQMNFLKLHLKNGDPWSGKRIDTLDFPADIIVVAVQRKSETIVPRGDVVLLPNDIVVLAAKTYAGDREITLLEVTVSRLHPWNSTAIRDLDISRQSFIVSVKRGQETIVPYGDLVLKTDDVVVLLTKKRISEATKVKI